jgi:hypothetical protein
MGDAQSNGVDVFVRVGENEELLIATIRDATSTSGVLRALALELERLAGPVRVIDRLVEQRHCPPDAPPSGIGTDFYAEDLA